MTIQLQRARLRLADRQPLELTDSHGARLRGVGGAAWITVDNDSRDWVLEPGDEFVVASSERVLVTALGAGGATLDLCTRPRRVARSALAAIRHAFDRLASRRQTPPRAAAAATA